MEKPNLSKQAFWDVDFDSLDYQNKSNFIIGRVFEYGTLMDLKEVLNGIKFGTTFVLQIFKPNNTHVKSSISGAQPLPEIW